MSATLTTGGAPSLPRSLPDRDDAPETTIASLDPESLQPLWSEFYFGDGWDHHVELEQVREDRPASEPEVGAAQGEAPRSIPLRTNEGPAATRG